jgi:hypothetical protein
VGHAHASKLSVYRTSSDYEVVGNRRTERGSLRKRAAEQEPYRDLRWMTREQLLNESGLQAVLVETEVRGLLGQRGSLHPSGQACAPGQTGRREPGAVPPHPRRSGSQAILMVQMGYMYRYNPGRRTLLRDFLRRGWLGEIFEVHTVMSKVVDPASRRELARYRGGILFELGCHILDLTIGVLGAPASVTSHAVHSSTLDDGLLDNMLAVLTYPKATATVKSSALEVDGGDRRHFVVCGTEGTFQIQPLDNPSARVTMAESKGAFRKGSQEIKFPKYTRYVGDAADMAKVIRGEKGDDFSREHDLTVQTTLLKACGLPAS